MGRNFCHAFLSSLVMFLCFHGGFVTAEYRQSEHRPATNATTPVTEPGYYNDPDTIYILTDDLSCPSSGLFLGSGATLDLNGYTLTFADADYGHVPNYGFEHGLSGWDTKKAPDAEVVDTHVHVFAGEHVLKLAAGDEIVSGWVDLPVAGRSYFAMCGVCIPGQKVSVIVENGNGKPVTCVQDYGDSTRVSCPVENRTVRLGGGFVTAHMHGLPAGRYRIRVRAETDCLVDHIDIRPAMDVGIGIIGRTYPFAHTDDLYAGGRAIFFDQTVPGTSGTPRKDIGTAEGPGTITIRNGVIKSGARGVLSWGVCSTADDVKIVLDNVRIVSQGINTNAADIPFGTVSNCRFEIDTPFIINRHASEHAVVLRGKRPSDVFDSEFIGGQGCLTVRGRRSHVHDNLFVNRQTVTNHYCVMAAGDSSMIYRNRFEPEIGSGLEIYVHKYIEVFDNTFRIEASPPTCEYGHEDYSVNAIRIADYRAEPGSPNSCAENRVYGNIIHVTGRDYPEYTDYIPMAYGVFHSVSGGVTYYYNNTFIVDHQSPGTKAECAALYIVGGNGGIWHDNTIMTNTHAFWVATRYGNLENADIFNNTVIKTEGAPDDFAPIRMGFAGRDGTTVANVRFRSNTFRNTPFSIAMTDEPHQFETAWTVTVRIVDSTDTPRTGMDVSISDRNGTEVFSGKTNSDGEIRSELTGHHFNAGEWSQPGPYTIAAGNQSKTIDVEENTLVTIVTE